MNPPFAVAPKLQGLQALRFIAAALVLWTHLRFATGPSNRLFIATTFGAIGVDVFFVISGFVISLAASKIGFNFLLFFAHRLARVVPLYYLFSVVILIELVLTREQVGIRRAWNSFLFVPLLDRGNLTDSLHPYGWTLNFEMWFYLLFGGMLAFLGANRAKFWLPVVLAVGSVGFFPFYQGSWLLPSFAFHPMVLEFCAGCLLFHFRQRLGLVFALVCLGSLPLFLYAAWITDELGWYHLVLPDVFLSYSRALIWGGFALSLVGLVVYLDQGGKMKVPAWLVLLGDASYSIYLIQPFGVRTAQSLLPAGGWVAGCVFVLGSTFGGLLLHLVVERRLSTRARSLLEKVFWSKQPPLDSKAPTRH